MRCKEQEYPTAIVMNMFYTGLGIARSLGEQGVPVIGLSAHPGIYGEFTRYARSVAAPDSRAEPEALLRFLLRTGESMNHRAVVFPTRDDDVVFLDRYREQLSAHFELVIPESAALRASLDKWETYLLAQRAGVETPRCWLIESDSDLERTAAEAAYPCVLKPVESHHWRRGSNWEKVGGRKAVAIYSREQLSSEYAAIARADRRALLQEMVLGDDTCLAITACYLDRNSRLAAVFHTRKVLQAPESFGTGIIVQAADFPELVEPTVRLLQEARFTGIAEVEYKWDAAKKQYQLIEINPRPWDQHRLGNGCGVNLMYLAYAERAGLPLPPIRMRNSRQLWIAEDALLVTALTWLWKRNRKLGSLFGLLRGRRTYAIWCVRDPMPLVMYLVRKLIPGLIRTGVKAVWEKFASKAQGNALVKGGTVYEKSQSHH
jgi:predicted ATP-grasp superfamily ATP-dependent carboligase